jgi:hypothetical protein
LRSRFIVERIVMPTTAVARGVLARKGAVAMKAPIATEAILLIKEDSLSPLVPTIRCKRTRYIMSMGMMIAVLTMVNSV